MAKTRPSNALNVNDVVQKIARQVQASQDAKLTSTCARLGPSRLALVTRVRADSLDRAGSTELHAHVRVELVTLTRHWLFSQLFFGTSSIST